MSTHPRVLVCGNYGEGVDAVNGQTIKTQTLRDALIVALGADSVSTLDTSLLFRKPFSLYFTARKRFAQSTHVILLPGPRAVHVLLTLFLRWKRKDDKDIRYVVIGGFLPDFLPKHRRLRDACLQLDGIYVETHSMAESLTTMGLRNVHVLPNFRSFDKNMSRSHAPAGSPLKLVFCSRVFKEKGIEEAMAAVESINTGVTRPVVSLDVYGPVDDSYKKRFTHIVKASPSTTYKGVLPPTDVYTVLPQYDLMVFPTYYYGEGFAGTIVDAFVAGVPVLASDWGYNSELIEHGRTGAICKARSAEELTKTLERYVRAPHLLTEMRHHCIERAQEYHIDHALRELLVDLTADPAPAHRRPGAHPSPSKSHGSLNALP